MKETAVQVNNRKIRNGIRKQREKIEREQQEVWDKLTDTGEPNSGEPKTEFMYGLDVEQAMIDALTANICNGGSEDE